MSWVKRNIYFLISSIAAVVLLGAAAWYGYSQLDRNKKSWDTLNSSYEELRSLASQKPNPGNSKVDNIELAKQQRTQMVAIIEKLQKYFTAAPSIPASTNVSNQEFAGALRDTISQLQRNAADSGVSLPPDYAFSFFAERRLVVFQQGSAPSLAAQLGEVKVISDVLFGAKINALDNNQRERVSPDDMNGPQSDYLDASQVSMTNELAVLTPYQVTFRCFSSELAGVLAGFANRPNGIIVKTINVEPATGASVAGMPPGMSPEMAREGGYQPGAYIPPGTPMPGQPGATPAATVGKGGLPIVLDEKPLRVTLVVEMVKLLPKK